MITFIAYPEGPENDTIDILEQKVEAGADFIVTQLFYDSDRFIEWIKKVRSRGPWFSKRIKHFPSQHTGISVPIIPGVMPIQTYASFLRVVKLCGAQVPPNTMADLQNIQVRCSVKSTGS